MTPAAASTWTPHNPRGGIVPTSQSNTQEPSNTLTPPATLGLGQGPSPDGPRGVDVGTLLSGSAGESVGGERFTSFSAPLSLDFAVNQETRNKIWEKEYVEFGSLLDPSSASLNKILLQRTDKGENTLCVVPSNNKLPKNINEWISAFCIFSSVYTNKFPGDNAKLLKYGQVVRQIAAEGGNFNLYDVNFRKLRQVTDLPWNHFHTELYIKSTQTNQIKLKCEHGVNLSSFHWGIAFVFAAAYLVQDIAVTNISSKGDTIRST